MRNDWETEICSFTSHVWWFKVLIAETLGFSAHRSSPWCYFTSTHIAFQSKDIRAYHLFLFFYCVSGTFSLATCHLFSISIKLNSPFWLFLRNNRCKVFLFPSSFRMACVYLYHFCIIKAFECRRHPNTEPVLIDEEVRSSLLTLRFFCKNKLKAGCSEASLSV